MNVRVMEYKTVTVEKPEAFTTVHSSYPCGACRKEVPAGTKMVRGIVSDNSGDAYLIICKACAKTVVDDEIIKLQDRIRQLIDPIENEIRALYKLVE